MKDQFDLTGRRALVTGASRGIGRAIARALADVGAEVFCVARNDEGLRRTAELIRAQHRIAHVHRADLRAPASIVESVDAAAEAMGGIDILVNNAADDRDASIEEHDLETWRRIHDLNVQAAFLMCQAAGDYLIDGGGKVINVASVLAHVGVRDNTAYIASKHALLGLTRGLALEWARKAVQVNVLAPGFVRTDMTASVHQDEKSSTWITRRTPMGRWGEVEDFTGPAVFLASSASDFITGQSLVVDGGWTVQ